MEKADDIKLEQLDRELAEDRLFFDLERLPQAHFHLRPLIFQASGFYAETSAAISYSSDWLIGGCILHDLQHRLFERHPRTNLCLHQLLLRRQRLTPHVSLLRHFMVIFLSICFSSTPWYSPLWVSSASGECVEGPPPRAEARLGFLVMQQCRCLILSASTPCNSLASLAWFSTAGKLP